jgi:hypothetical protein
MSRKERMNYILFHKIHEKKWYETGKRWERDYFPNKFHLRTNLFLSKGLLLSFVLLYSYNQKVSYHAKKNTNVSRNMHISVNIYVSAKTFMKVLHIYCGL